MGIWCSKDEEKIISNEDLFILQNKILLNVNRYCKYYDIIKKLQDENKSLREENIDLRKKYHTLEGRLNILEEQAKKIFY